MDITRIARLASVSLIFALALGAAAYAQNQGASRGTGALHAGLGCLCGQLLSMMPIIAMLLVVGAAVVYAAGQVGGGELRAKASGWSTAMIIGVVIGIMMVLILPVAFGAIFANSSGTALSGQNFDFQTFCSANCCSGTC